MRQLKYRPALNIPILSYLGGVEGKQQGPAVGQEYLHGIIPKLPPALVHLLDLLVRPGEGRCLCFAMKALYRKTRGTEKNKQTYEATSCL